MEPGLSGPRFPSFIFWSDSLWGFCQGLGPHWIVDGPKINLLLIITTVVVNMCYADIMIAHKGIDKVGHDLIQHVGIHTV